MKTRRKVLFAVGLMVAAIAAILMWRHTQTQPANAAATNPAAVPAASVATTPTPAATPSAPVAAAPSQRSPVAVQGAVTTAPTAVPLPTPTPAASVAATPTPQTPAPVPDPTPNSAATTAVAQAAPALPRIDEVTATRRMILAHAPLRDPKVADPDSAENRQVLQTMVAKALARAKTQP